MPDEPEPADPSEERPENSLTAGPRADIGALVSRARGLLDGIVPHLPERHPEPRRRTWLYVVYVVRRWIHEDRAGGMAAILTIHTLLSTVPIIGVGLMLVGRMDRLHSEELVRDFFRSLVPQTDRADQMAQGAMELAHNVSVSNLGVWGFVATMLIAFALFSTLEQTYNRIWRVIRKRSLLVKFTMFYTLATLAPVLILVSVTQPYVAGAAQGAWPALTTAGGLVLLNRFMPNTTVEWRPALVGGLITALLLETGKYAFGYYATRFALRTYEGVYGPLAILPILVLWSYLSWFVILLGAEIAFVVQRRRAIALQGYVNRYVRERTEVALDSGRTAARLMLAICDHYSHRGAGIRTETLAERFHLSVDRVGELLQELQRQGFVLDIEDETDAWVPARPLEQLRVAAILDLFEREHTRLPRADRLGALFQRLDGVRADIVGDITFHDLVSVPRDSGPRRPDE